MTAGIKGFGDFEAPGSPSGRAAWLQGGFPVRAGPQLSWELAPSAVVALLGSPSASYQHCWAVAAAQVCLQKKNSPFENSHPGHVRGVGVCCRAGTIPHLQRVRHHGTGRGREAMPPALQRARGEPGGSRGKDKATQGEKNRPGGQGSRKHPRVPCWSCREANAGGVRVPAREQGPAAACSLGTCGQAASPASSDLSHLLFPYLHTQQFLKCLHNCVHRVPAFLPFSNSIAYFSQLRCCLIMGTLQ